MDSELSYKYYKIKIIDRALKIPSINIAWDISFKIYEKLKNVNLLTNWAFDIIEIILEKSLTIVRFIEKPIYNIDKGLCRGIDFVEVKLPIIKENPAQILEKIYRPALQIFVDLKNEIEQRVRIITLHTYYKAHYLRVYSWKKADKVMSTETGINILKTVDNTTGLAVLMLDKYLPVLENETNINYYYHDDDDDDDECSEHVKLHHTIIKLGKFSNRATRRIYNTLMDKWQHMYSIEILVIILHALIVIQTIKLTEILFNYVLKIINYFHVYGPKV